MYAAVVLVYAMPFIMSIHRSRQTEAASVWYWIKTVPGGGTVCPKGWDKSPTIWRICSYLLAYTKLIAAYTKL